MVRRARVESAVSMTATRVPNRPVWAEVYRDTAHTSSWRDQELLSVTRETLQLARGALLHVMAQDYYHNHGAAEQEISEVLAAHELDSK